MCLSKGQEALRQAIKEGILPNKKIAFISTAGETYENPYFVDDSRKQLQKLGIELIELDITNESSQKLRDKLKNVDGVFVAGGNTFFMLQQMQKKKFNIYLRDQVRSGLPYFGESAGAVLLCESIEPAKPLDDPQDAPDIDGYRGLGLINFFPLPHVDREKYHLLFKKFIDENKDKLKIVQIRDDQAILTHDGNNYEILASSLL